MAGRSATASGSAPDASARSLALRLLREMRRGGGRAAPLLAAVRRRGVEERELRLATEILYGTLRWRPALRAAVRRLSRRREPAPELGDVLHLALYQILFLHRVPARAAVSVAVDQARSLGGEPAARYANGLLREAARRGTDLLRAPAGAEEAEALALRYAHPAWLVKRWLRRWGPQAAEALLVFDQEPPEVALWPAPDRGDVRARLAGPGVDLLPARFVPGALRARGGALAFSEPHRRGDFLIQDEASQLVAWMLERPLRGPALDMCAGSGGKTAQIAAAAAPGALLVAADRDRRPLRALRRRLERLGLPAPARLRCDWEAASPLRRSFAAVLLDAPCAGTGVLRRRPEIKERLQEADLRDLAGRQERLLAAAADLTAPGGELVYAVCSLEPEEGEQRIEGFLERRPEFARAGPAPAFPACAAGLLDARGDLRTLPWRDGVDGFFACRLRRRGGAS
jgi:16S rRNA (cytosine967-C5)-methyltransferase